MAQMDYRRLGLLEMVLEYYNNPTGFFVTWHDRQARRAMFERIGLDDRTLGLLVAEDLPKLTELGAGLAADTSGHVSDMANGARWGGNPVYLKSAAPAACAVAEDTDIDLECWYDGPAPTVSCFSVADRTSVPLEVISGPPSEGGRAIVQVRCRFPAPGSYTFRVAVGPDTEKDPAEHWDELIGAVRAR